MSDRAAEARAEAERQAEAVLAVARPTQANRSYAAGVRAGLLHGAEWADANPKPHTITRAGLDEAATRFAEVGASGDWVSLEDMLVVALGALGIEVEDNDE